MAYDAHDLHEDLIARSEKLAQSSNRGTRGRGRGGGGKSGGRAEMGRDVAISKALSKLLRHDAVKEGLVLDGEGYARLDQVLQWQRLKSLKATFSDIQLSVTENAKQRFALKINPEITPIPDATDTEPSHWLIRANQGHSIAIESASLLKPITLAADNVPEAVVHGTYFAFYPMILDSGGLKKMTRNHIHFSTGLPEDKGGVISGMRNDAEILIYIDIRKSLEDGAMLWWISDNGVILSEGDENGVVGMKYWKKVVGRKQEIGILWEDGVEVGELAQSFRGRKPPIGKGSRTRREEVRGKGKVRDRGGGRESGKGGMEVLDALGGEDTAGTGLGP